MFAPFVGRCWRMIGVRWQHAPLSGEGAALTGGRWNRPGQPALYLSLDHATAISEYHQMLVRPGTLVPYDVDTAEIADLTAYERRSDALALDLRAAFLCDWKAIWKIDGDEPVTWRMAAKLRELGAQGALVPSAQLRGGANLVLWHWTGDGDEGASLKVIDPATDLEWRVS